MAYHRTAARDPTAKFYQHMYEVGIEHFYIELIEECPCDTLDQLRKQEGHFIREMGTLNSLIPGRTRKEHHEDNKDKLKAYKEENKEVLLKKQRDYHHLNKEAISEKRKRTITCPCGVTFQIYGRSRHERKSKQHQLYLQQHQQLTTMV